MNLRKLLVLLAAQVCLSTGALAQSFPEHPVRVVVPYPPGGTTDVLMRLLQSPMAAASGQPVIIDNRPGGAAVIGTGAVARATPDGYTILGTDLSILVNPGLMKTLPYDTERDLRGVSMVARAPLVLLAHPSVPADSLDELVALAKREPGKLNYASGGYGTSTHIAGEMFTRAIDTEIVHVPFQGVAPAMQALLGGQVQLYFGGTTTALPYLQSGQLKALAITGDAPSPLLPEVPTFASAGVEGVEADTYWGVYAPAGTPDERIEALNGYVVAALKDPAVAERARNLGLTLIGNSASEHTEQMRQMIAAWRDFTAATGIQLD